MTRTLRTLFLCLVFTAIAGAVTLSNTAVNPTGTGSYSWVYNLQIDALSTMPGGSFFTLYDVAGILGSTTPNEDWFADINSLGHNPDFTAPVDNPSLDNITFFYFGDPVLTNVDLTFAIDSSYGGPVLRNYTESSYAPDGTQQATTSSTTVPDTPEPCTLGLFAIGISAGLLLRHRRRMHA